ncbi:hypothetical protein [Mycolicibacterium mageritense]|uniref:hypothetical protein n=1 Tax=Mycolicibacterium mageritense TaxID=53462 RepID=UPI0011D8B054|nr:hypothetical protein [Mycolicibacterium mageritense]TXI56481.1 MAG: hypothetical protein E6Q55_28870 [Mycolicibacterium mageritense]
MTAAARRPDLHLVPDTDSTETSFETYDGWQAETVLAQWEPENQLIGSLMWLTAAKAAPILAAVDDTAIWRPTARWAYELIRDLADNGEDPNPVNVMAAGRKRRSREALQPDQAPTAAQIKQLALYVFDAYRNAQVPDVAAGNYARQVLEEAYRRGFTEAGIRMQQLGETDAEPEALTTQFIAIRNELADLRRRAEAAAKPGWWTP